MARKEMLSSSHYGMSLVLFNTLHRKKEEFISLHEKKVSLYTCGPTVYNYAHIGNFRAYLSADILRRWLAFGKEYVVEWAMNITNVDDKTIRDSRKTYPEKTPKEALALFTNYYEDAFFEDMETLGIPKSDFCAIPRATDYIPQMQNLVRHIAERGFAKEIGGSVFFDVKKWANADSYGKLCHIDFSALKTGTRTLADEVEKDDFSDFVLWKAHKEGEPAWDFDFFGTSLPGRPGWHLECSAMEQEIFGLPFDIHTGGVDLVFPHHEDEIAQSACGYGTEPTRYFVHNEHLLVEGKKMSKSLGNFFTLRDLTERGHSAESIRFFLVTNHYRTKLNLTEEALTASANALSGIRNALREILCGEGGEVCPLDTLSPLLEKAKIDFSNAMDDDLNTPVAIATIHGLLKGLSPKKPLSSEAIHECKTCFSFFEQVLGVSFLPHEKEISPLLLQLAEERQHARKEKRWKDADDLRQKIFEQGFEVRDRNDGFDLFPIA